MYLELIICGYLALILVGNCNGLERNGLEGVCDKLEKTDESWNIISRVDKETNALNLAFPDFAAEYWITCFTEKSRPLFWGDFPEWAHYSALTAYDTYGSEISGASVESKYYNQSYGPIDLFQNISIDTSFIVLFRIYSPFNVTDNTYRRINTETNPDTDTFDERFRISEQGIFSKSANLSTAIANANRFEKEIQRIIRFIIPRVNPDDYETQFKYMNSSDLIGLFPNSNAIYLMAFTKKQYLRRSNPYVRIDGVCQIPNDYLYYYDIMAVNRDTTETDDTISFEQLGKQDMCVAHEPYVVIISKSWKSDYSKIPNVHFIHWKHSNTFPVIVVRYLLDLKSVKGQEYANILKTYDGEPHEHPMYGFNIGVPIIQYYN